MEKQNTGFTKRILKIALPIIISNLVGQLQMMIDKAFLGRLELTCMSAVGNALSPMWTTMSIIFALTMGGTILISQAIGEGNIKKANSISAAYFKYNNYIALGLFLFWIFGARLVFLLMKVDATIIDMSVNYVRYFAPVFLLTGISAAVLSLLQVNERTKVLVLYGVIRSGLNIFLDYCLIFGKFGMPAMGVCGAALATTIAEYIGGIFIAIYIIAKKDFVVKPSIREILNAKWKNYLFSAKVGVPAALEEFAWNGGNVFLIAMLNNISAVAAGVYSVVFSVELLPVVFLSGFGQASLTISGQEKGRGNIKSIRRIVRTAMIMSLIVDLTILLCFVIFPKTIMGVFTKDEGIIASSVLYLVIVGIDLFPKSANIIFGSGIRGYGDTSWMLKTQIFGTMFIISVSSILVLGFHVEMAWIFCLVVADETLRCVMNYFRLRQIK